MFTVFTFVSPAHYPKYWSHGHCFSTLWPFPVCQNVFEVVLIPLHRKVVQKRPFMVRLTILFTTSQQQNISSKDTINSLQNKLIWPNHAYYCLGFGKLFNVLQSPIGREASSPMRNIEKSLSAYISLYLIALVKRKVAEFYHNIDRRRYLIWLNWPIFVIIWRE